MTDSDSRTRLAPSLLAVLVLLAVVTPIAMDLYLSSFPRIAADLGTSEPGVQLTLTMFLVGVAVGQLIFGPLADRFGRRQPLLVGVIIFVIASVAAVVAPTLELLLLARLLQGLGGSAGMVIGRAIVADLAKGPAAARLFSLMMVAGTIAPVLAPVTGSMVSAVVGWRGVLVVVAGFAVLMALGVIFVVKETLPVEQRTARDAGVGLRALRSPLFASAAVTFACSTAVLMSYIAASPFIYQEVIGLGPRQFSVAFAVNSIGLMLGSAIGARLVRTWALPRVMSVGIAGQCGASLVALIIVATGVPAGWIALPLWCAMVAVGLVVGPVTALAMGAVKGARGVASAVLGASQYALGGLGTALVGRAEGAWGLVVMMVAFSSSAAVGAAVVRRVMAVCGDARVSGSR